MFKIILTSLIILFTLTGCSPMQQPHIKKVLQTNGATLIHNNYKNSINQLLIYQKKLNIRNPKGFKPNTADAISNNLKNLTNNYFLFNKNGKLIKQHKDYLNIAFDKGNIKYRNDYLILGIYKLLYSAYDMNTKHKFTSLTYKKHKLQKAYKLMQIIQWKIKNDKNKKGEYLFKTWQNNWQIQLAKKLREGVTPSWKLIKNLEFIKNKRETIFDPSNHSFALLTNNMIQNIKRDLKIMGEEPVEVATETLSFFIFL